MVIVTCTLLCCDDVTYVPALWNFQKSWLGTLPLWQKIHHFFFYHTWGTRFKYLPEGCPYMLMYLALHIMQWFSHILDVFIPKIRRKISILTFLLIKTNVAYTRLEVIAKQRSALQVEFITGVKLICYFVLYYCCLHWAHPPNMAVDDLDFYYTLYLWIWWPCIWAQWRSACCVLEQGTLHSNLLLSTQVYTG